ncbi:hypothetical protein K3727_08605 [Rhodobacteraceae bacterium M382]|nr:hypothetical protein K3727_08605 [Rhodobacteraceae bacterium M382]
MFLELIGVIFAGFAVAGVVMLLNKLTGGRLPRWAAPVGAGLGMIIATVTSEYGWYARTVDGLPDGLVVAETVEHTSWYRPWTQVVPYVNRFAAVDMASIQDNAALPGQRLAELYFFGRWAPVNKLPVVMDCDSHRRALLPPDAEFDADGRVTNADWVQADADDAILTTICARE